MDKLNKYLNIAMKQFFYKKFCLNFPLGEKNRMVTYLSLDF